MYPCQKEGKTEGKRGYHCDECTEKSQCPFENKCESAGMVKGTVGEYCLNCPQQENCTFN